jgi:hypothetical protein
LKNLTDVYPARILLSYENSHSFNRLKAIEYLKVFWLPEACLLNDFTALTGIAKTTIS